MLEQRPCAREQQRIGDEEGRQAKEQRAKGKGVPVDVETDNLGQDYGVEAKGEDQAAGELLHGE